MYEELSSKIEERLASILSDLRQENDLVEASNYMLSNGGKRIRPLCCLALCKDLLADVTTCLDPAISLEIIHTASLIHDDLPALDNDDYRRGQESCHKKFNEATAILTADFLQALAFRLIADCSIAAEQKVNLIKTLSNTFIKICLGQELDLRSSKLDNISSIHSLKTAALFKASFQFAAIVCGKSTEITEQFGRLGNLYGLYFQAVNDYFDVFQSDKTGRPYSSDAKNKKLTIFTIDHYTEAQAKKYLENYYVDLTGKIEQAFKEMKLEAKNLMGIIEFFEEKFRKG